MSSPRKRFKLTSSPKSTARHFDASPTPSVSSIDSTEHSAVPSSSSTAISSQSSSSEAQRKSGAVRRLSSSASQTQDYIGEDYDAYFTDLGRIRRTGQIWKLYCPVEENSLYAKILNDPKNVPDTVTEFLLLYTNYPDEVIVNLIQLFIDLAAFQKFNVAQHFDVKNSKESSKKIVDMLESGEVVTQYPTTVMEGKYLFRERNITLAKTLRMAVFNFLQKLIKLAHLKECLYDEKFTPCLFDFIRNMQLSKARCIKHTGVVIGVKILTALVLVYNELISNDSEDLDSSKEEQKDCINSLIECLYIGFFKNCRLPDSKVVQMRIECIIEAKIWIKYFPKIFLSEFQAASSFVKLLMDESNEVRLATLTACEELFNVPQVIEYLKPVIKELTDAIAGRFWDISIDVAVGAINFFSHLLRIDAQLLTQERFNQIVGLMFDRHAPIGKAASTFFTTYFEIERKVPSNVILTIAHLFIEGYKDQDAKKELLVEGFLYTCEIFRDWQLFCNLILSENVKEPLRVAIAELFSESAYQYLTGKSDIKRLMSVTVTDTNDRHEEICCVLPHLLKILSEHSNVKILAGILRIISVVNINLLKKNHTRELTEIARGVRIIFNNYFDHAVLENAAKVMHHIATVPHLAGMGRIHQYSTVLCRENVTELRECLQNPVEHGKLRATRIALLYEHYNLNEQLSFNEIVLLLEGANYEMSIALLKCCKWNLVWQLKDATDRARVPDQTFFDKLLRELPKASAIFEKYTFILLQKTEQDEDLLLEVYHNTCDFYLTLIEVLDTAYKFTKAFANISFEIRTENQPLLLNFLETNIIHNKHMKLDARRQEVIKYVDLILNDVLPIEKMVDIFKYYYVFNEEYGNIVEQVLAHLHNHCEDHTVYFLIVLTLRTGYEKILERYSVVDIRNEESVQLKALAEQFSMFKQIYKSTQEIYTMGYLLMQTAFIKEANLSFLYFLKPFLGLINNNDSRNRLHHAFKKLVSKPLEKNDAVLYFAKNLKDLNVKLGKPVPESNSELKTPKPKQRKKENVPPKKVSSKRSSKKENLPPPQTESSTNEDDMTIHDSSDDTPVPESSKQSKSNTPKTPKPKKNKKENVPPKTSKPKKGKKENVPPKKVSSKPSSSSKKENVPPPQTESSANEDDMTIHDSSDDDLGMSNMSISN